MGGGPCEAHGNPAALRSPRNREATDDEPDVISHQGNAATSFSAIAPRVLQLGHGRSRPSSPRLIRADQLSRSVRAESKYHVRPTRVHADVGARRFFDRHTPHATRPSRPRHYRRHDIVCRISDAEAVRRIESNLLRRERIRRRDGSPNLRACRPVARSHRPTRRDAHGYAPSRYRILARKRIQCGDPEAAPRAHGACSPR